MYYKYNENVISKEYYNSSNQLFYERIITYETSHYINIQFGDWHLPKITLVVYIHTIKHI